MHNSKFLHSPNCDQVQLYMDCAPSPSSPKPPLVSASHGKDQITCRMNIILRNWSLIQNKETMNHTLNKTALGAIIIILKEICMCIYILKYITFCVSTIAHTGNQHIFFQCMEMFSVISRGFILLRINSMQDDSHDSSPSPIPFLLSPIRITFFIIKNSQLIDSPEFFPTFMESSLTSI